MLALLLLAAAAARAQTYYLDLAGQLLNVPNRTLDAYQSSAAAAMVRAFLAMHPDHNPQLRTKLLQAADDQFRPEKLMR